MRRRTSTLHPLLCAGLLSLTLLLAGCAQADPQPKFEKPAASPTVAKEETAEEFIKRWAVLEKEMQNTGETDAYREITQGCDVCEGLADDMEEVYAAGGWVKTEGMTIERVDEFEENSFRVSADLAPTTYVKAAGESEGGFKGGRRVYVIYLDKRPGGWRLVHLMKEPS